MRYALFVVFIVLNLAGSLIADVKLPAVFGDHMVLQRNSKVPVWGWAAPNEIVTVEAGKVKATGTADAEGKWSVQLDRLTATDQPTDVTVVGKNTITFHDVLIGDVWVCSGQSNMEFLLSGAHNAVEEIPKANHPTLRLFMVTKKVALDPQPDCIGQWSVCTPEIASKFSAVGYFFGREILQDQKVPVGMIGTYWGGTPAEAWTSLEALKSDPVLKGHADNFEKVKTNLPDLKLKYDTEVLPKWKTDHDQWDQEIGKSYRESLAKWNADVAQAAAAAQPVPTKPKPAKPEPRKPSLPDQDPHLATVLTNGMIAPIVPYAIKGAIWYQGESNAGKAAEYNTLFPAMITDWRTRWAQGDFPFIWVQLANFRARNTDPIQTSDGWPGLREAQLKTLKLAQTGMAVTIDIGQGDNIHPKDKWDVGHRLALSARHMAYAENLIYSGPLYDSMAVQGSEVRLKFKNAGTGLTISAAPSSTLGVAPALPAAELKGFSIAGEDRKFVWAKARIEGDSVIVSSSEVKQPLAVRYGWADNPEVNFYNKENLPASPFRTDDWQSQPVVR